MRVVIQLLRKKHNRKEHEVAIRIFLRERSLTLETSLNKHFKIELTPILAICAVSDTRSKARGGKEDSMESINDESDEDQGNKNDGDAGIFHEAYLRNNNFKNPDTVRLRTGKSHWTFREIVDDNTLNLHSRINVLGNLGDSLTKGVEKSQRLQ